MAAKIQERLNLETSLIPGAGGEFELVVDGQLLYSKRRTGNFPVEEDVVNNINSLS